MTKEIEKPYFAIREPQNAQGRPTHEEIEVRAYQLYVEHGRVGGHDVEDWLQAERELNAKQGQTGRIIKAAA